MSGAIVGFATNLVGPAVVLGIAAASLYGLLAVSLVLTYRVSRTIGFVQGGIALFTVFLYWWLTGVKEAHGPATRLDRVSATLITMVAGAVLVALMGVLSFVLLRTRTGTFIRAIADDPDASRWVGIPLSRVGSAVYGVAGALSALAGVLMTTTIGLNLFVVLLIFLRALTVSVLGGFRSLPLALAGCLVLGVGEALFAVDGTLTHGQREMILTGVLFGLVLLINWFRSSTVIEATSQ